MRIGLQVVDAFTDRRFSGNPAAVCVLEAERGEAWMQAVAREMHLSETAFLRPAGGGFRLRWFTPTVEVRLCGHATLASAHVLWETGMLAPGEAARFDTLSGRLTCEREDDWIAMDFPAHTVEPAVPPPALLDGLRVAAPAAVRRAGLNWLVALPDEAAVRAARPDFSRLAELPVQGVIVTAPAADGTVDFVSRYFAPASGVDEDPVTGSAHCALGPYWASLLGRTDLVGRQVSARGGVVKVAVRGERVTLRGQAVTVSRVELVGEPG